MGDLTGRRTAQTATADDDLDLLRRYARTGDEPSFAALVRRHVGWVYAASVRQVGGDAHLAEDVAQAVFVILARRAGSLPDGTRLAGWLFNTVRFAAAEARRKRARRRKHEARAAIEPDSAAGDEDGGNGDRAWERLSPVLDETMAMLGDADRRVVMLRYFESRGFDEIAAALGVNEDAARKRVSRAVRRMRELLVKRGTIVPAIAVLSLLLTRAASAAPAGLIERVGGAAGAGAASPVSLAIALRTTERFARARRRLATAILACVGVLLVGLMSLAIAWRIVPADEPIDPLHGLRGGTIVHGDAPFRDDDSYSDARRVALPRKPVRGRWELHTAPPTAPRIADFPSALELHLWPYRYAPSGGRAMAARSPGGAADDESPDAGEDPGEEFEDPFGSFAQMGPAGGGGGGGAANARGGAGPQRVGGTGAGHAKSGGSGNTTVDVGTVIDTPGSATAEASAVAASEVAASEVVAGTYYLSGDAGGGTGAPSFVDMVADRPRLSVNRVLSDSRSRLRYTSAMWGVNGASAFVKEFVVLHDAEDDGERFLVITPYGDGFMAREAGPGEYYPTLSLAPINNGGSIGPRPGGVGADPGWNVVQTPEPSAAVVLGIGSVLSLARRRRTRS